MTPPLAKRPPRQRRHSSRFCRHGVHAFPNVIKLLLKLYVSQKRRTLHNNDRFSGLQS